MRWLARHSEDVFMARFTVLLHGYVEHATVPQIFGCHSFLFEEANGIICSTHLGNNRCIPAGL